MVRLFNQYISLKTVLLLVVEASILVASVLFGASLRFLNHPVEFRKYIHLPLFPVQVLILDITILICFYYHQLYDSRTLRHSSEQVIYLGQSVGEACVLLGILYFVAPDLMIGRGVFFISMALGTVSIVFSRALLDRTWHVAAPKQKILIIGTGPLAGTTARELISRPDLNVRIVGFVRSGAEYSAQTPVAGCRILGSIQDLELITQATEAVRIIVALEERRQALPVRELVRLRVGGTIVEDAHTIMSALSGRVWLKGVHPSWFVFSDGFRRSGMLLAGKRLIDLICASVGLVLSLPIMALVAAAIRLDSKGPVIYKQRRVGMGGRCFDVLKFRSMYVDAERDSGARWASVDDPRTTRVGKYLRKFRLDEFPQFINVVRGDMSFVGPRPERPEFVEQLRESLPYYDERHTVRPGITGWAQIQYKYGSSIDDAYRKLEYDLFYLKNMSMMFDIAIIFGTLRTILSGQGGR